MIVMWIVIILTLLTTPLPSLIILVVFLGVLTIGFGRSWMWL